MLDKLRLKYYGFLMCVGRIAGLVFRIFTYQYKNIYIYIPYSFNCLINLRRPVTCTMCTTFLGQLLLSKRVHGLGKQSFEDIYHKRLVMSPLRNPSIVKIINLILSSLEVSLGLTIRWRSVLQTHFLKSHPIKEQTNYRCQKSTVLHA